MVAMSTTYACSCSCNVSLVSASYSPVLQCPPPPNQLFHPSTSPFVNMSDTTARVYDLALFLLSPSRGKRIGQTSAFTTTKSTTALTNAHLKLYSYDRMTWRW